MIDTNEQLTNIDALGIAVEEFYPTADDAYMRKFYWRLLLKCAKRMSAPDFAAAIREAKEDWI